MEAEGAGKDNRVSIWISDPTVSPIEPDLPEIVYSIDPNDLTSDGIDNDNDGKVDSYDDDEFGEPRLFASKVAVQKIAEDIINDIMTTW